MSCPLKEHELKMSQIKNHAYAVVRVVKHFKYYVLSSHTLVLVPDTAVKSILTQQELGSQWGNWIAKV